MGGNVRGVTPYPAAPAALQDLARAYGIDSEVTDWRQQRCPVAEPTLRAVLAAMGVPARTDEEIERALLERRLAPWRRPLPPCVVVREGEMPSVRLVRPQAAPAGELSIELEAGGTLHVPVPSTPTATGEVGGVRLAAVEVPLPADLPLGWHRLRLTGTDRAECRLVVTPRRLELPGALAEKRSWGFWLQLYAVRSARSWGMGDLADLAELAEWSARELGAGFLLVNPLHAAEPSPPISASPYLPSSRRFAHASYLRIEDLPEYALLGEADRAIVEAWAAQCRVGNAEDSLDRDGVWTAKRSALELMHALPRDPAREAGYAAYREREGHGLVDFATWCTLTERYGPSWRAWPEELRDPRTEAVAAARAGSAGRVDFWCWVQWVLDEQLAATQRRSREAGMGIGIVHDLAVGASPDSADAWALQDVLAGEVSVGAPPDAFNQQGQEWNQPAWLPDRLAEEGYEAYRLMLRSILRHAGGLRIDHVLGLFRLWWVPRGLGPGQGTYVHYDADALLGILALEARRSGAVVVGEDLGVVTQSMRDRLRERGILGNSLLWFEVDSDGRPVPPEDWRELCMATVGTHDLPPIAGFLAGEHLRVRRELGLLTRDWDVEVAENDKSLTAWLATFVQRGYLDPAAARLGADPEPQVLAAHRYLAATPARLLAVGLPDAAGDRRMINQPGTDTELPNWRLPLAGPSGKPVLLEEVLADPRTRAIGAILSAPPEGDVRRS